MPQPGTGDVNTPTVLYNGMIAPLSPYAIAGVIFYQGKKGPKQSRIADLLPEGFRLK